MADNIQDLTLQVLRQIRDEIVTTRTDLATRIDRTNERLDQTNDRLDHVEGTIDRRLGHVEETLVELAAQQTFVSKFVRSLATRDRDLAEDVDELRTRVDALERRVPG
jgi:chromosome segregation ATPase